MIGYEKLSVMVLNSHQTMIGAGGENSKCRFFGFRSLSASRFYCTVACFVDCVDELLCTVGCSGEP